MNLKSIFIFQSISVALLLQFFGVKGQNKPTFEEFIRKNIADKQEIEVFLNDDYTWAKFDSVLGYTLNNFMPKDGIDESATISTIQRDGQRRSFFYKEKDCRINTYGNSFTQCHQVSDGETWQQYLAAHLGEPIRNFGMGGYGAYQSYRRMMREESSDHKAKYIIYYLWGDDHTRSLLRCRYLTFKNWTNEMTQREGIGKMFHNNFWANLEMDLNSGLITEHENRLSKSTDLYKMSDPNWVWENVKDDLALQMQLFIAGRIRYYDTLALKKLASVLKIEFEPKKGQDPKREVGHLLKKYSFAASKYVLTKIKQFADEQNRKVLIVLFDPSVLRDMASGQPRYDWEIIEFLKKNHFEYFDMNLYHLNDYRANFKISFEDYLKRYLIGHYSPAGNHFFAFAIKSKIIEWLDPKPITYKDRQKAMIDFDGYLQY